MGSRSQFDNELISSLRLEIERLRSKLQWISKHAMYSHRENIRAVAAEAISTDSATEETPSSAADGIKGKQ